MSAVIRRLIILVSVCLAMLCRGTTYYIATNGIVGNTGLTTNSPWPISILYTIPPGTNTLVVMSGVYNTNIIVRKSFTTLKSQVKWGAKISVTAGVNSAGISVWPAPISNCTIDGFEVANSGMSGIILYGSNMTVQNCWVHDSGQGHNVNNGSGIVSDKQGSGSFGWCNMLFEDNLLENNGYSAGYDHGIYAGGTNCDYRNNVCRGNLGFGISVYANEPGQQGLNNVKVYNNLLYGNYGDAALNGHQLGFNALNQGAGTTNYAFNNTIISPRGKAVFVEWTTLLATNNIIISTNNGFNVYSPSGTVSWAFGDYNLAPRTLYTAGAHDVIVTNYGFVNVAKGLYWITSASAAKGHALAGVHGPVDFFGNPQSSVADIGAFQYNPVYALDARTLDPSPVGGADYWLVLSSPSPVAPSQLIINRKY